MVVSLVPVEPDPAGWILAQHFHTQIKASEKNCFAAQGENVNGSLALCQANVGSLRHPNSPLEFEQLVFLQAEIFLFILHANCPSFQLV